jgi:hedgehog protein
MIDRRNLALACLLLATACSERWSGGVSLSRGGADPAPLRLGQHVPEDSEADTVGASKGQITRESAAFQSLEPCHAPEVVFKDEEGTGADRLMTPRLSGALVRLGRLVGRTWPGVRVRVTEAWDERGEHGRGSLHYEGRAADVTTSDRDSAKLGKLGALAVQAGFDWVFYEDRSHVHVSVTR